MLRTAHLARAPGVPLPRPKFIVFLINAGAHPNALDKSCGSSKPRDRFEHGQLRCVGHSDCSSEGRNILKSGLCLLSSGLYEGGPACRVRGLCRVTVVESTKSRERAYLAAIGLRP